MLGQVFGKGSRKRESRPNYEDGAVPCPACCGGPCSWSTCPMVVPGPPRGAGREFTACEGQSTSWPPKSTGKLKATHAREILQRSACSAHHHTASSTLLAFCTFEGALVFRRETPEFCARVWRWLSMIFPKHSFKFLAICESKSLRVGRSLLQG